MDSIASQSRKNLSAACASDHSITSWAFAVSHVHNDPLLEAISPAALPRITEYKMPELVNTPWSFATMQWDHLPAMNAIAAASIANLTALNIQDLPNTAWDCAQLL